MITMEEETTVNVGPTTVDNKTEEEEAEKSNVESLEQRVHELDYKLRQMKEERDSIILENEELQEQLDMSNSAQSAGNIRINELRNELNKLTEDVTKVEYMCTSQEHEVKTLSDKMSDLNNLKETVKELNEDTKQFKEDFNRMRTHLNVAAKLELQTQEKMYESRLHHLESVLEEMRQRESHFMHLAEETAILKDQVDALRELSVISLKNEDHRGNAGGSGTFSDDDVTAKANAAVAAANAAHYAAIMDSCSDSSIPQMLLAQSPAALSDDNTLAKEMLVEEYRQKLPKNATVQASAPDDITFSSIDSPKSDEPSIEMQDMSEKLPLNETAVADLLDEDEGLEQTPSEYDNAKLMLRDMDENTPMLQNELTPELKNLPPGSIKVSGTLTLTKSSKDPLNEGNDLRRHAQQGCFPNVLTGMVTVWSTLFD